MGELTGVVQFKQRHKCGQCQRVFFDDFPDKVTRTEDDQEIIVCPKCMGHLEAFNLVQVVDE